MLIRHGRGAISKVLRGAGHTVFENDIVDYGQGQDSVQDFLDLRPAQVGEIDAVLTNPLYRLAQQFVRHALTLCPRVFMLLRLTFLESERRRDVLDETGLILIHVFRNRLPMMHRDSWAGNRASKAVAFAWYVWQRGYVGDATIGRISWKRGGMTTPRQGAHTASELRRSPRLHRNVTAAHGALAAMREGQPLNAQYVDGQPPWSLSGGHSVLADVASILTSNASVVPAGASLFAVSASQTWRFDP